MFFNTASFWNIGRFHFSITNAVSKDDQEIEVTHGGEITRNTLENLLKDIHLSLLAPFNHIKSKKRNLLNLKSQMVIFRGANVKEAN